MLIDHSIVRALAAISGDLATKRRSVYRPAVDAIDKKAPDWGEGDEDPDEDRAIAN